MDLCRKEKVKPTVESDHRNISRIAGHLWRNLTPEQQLPYHKLAEQAKRKHALLYPNYKYTPVYNRDRAAKSKDKGDHARRALIAEKERRSQAIAGLIEQGFEGDDLERELVGLADNNGTAVALGRPWKLLDALDSIQHGDLSTK